MARIHFLLYQILGIVRFIVAGSIQPPYTREKKHIWTKLGSNPGPLTQQPLSNVNYISEADIVEPRYKRTASFTYFKSQPDLVRHRVRVQDGKAVLLAPSKEYLNLRFWIHQIRALRLFLTADEFQTLS